MRIAIECRMLGCSGIGVFLAGILPYVLENRDHQFLLIGDEKKLSQYKGENIEIKVCHIPIFSLKELLGFPTAEINRCDAFFTPNYNIPLGIKIPVYSVVHDVIFLDIPTLTSKLGYLIRKFYLGMAIRRTKQLFTVSEFSRQRIIYHFNPAKKITVCYNGVSQELLEAKEERLPSSITRPYYIFVGNIKPHKGLATLLKAAQTVNWAQFVIVGNKDNFKTPDKELSALLETQSGNDKIIFTGKVSDGLLKSLYKNAEALIQPSIYEGFGIPPLEAMVLGTPAVVSDIEIFKEIYSDYPAKFFKTGDENSLREALGQRFQRINLTDSQKAKYSYKHTAEVIVRNISNRI